MARRNWLEVYMLALTALSGMVGLVAPEPNGIASAFPHWAQLTWFVGLTFGGLTALAGALVGTVRGLFILRAGLVPLSGLCFAMGLAALATSRGALGLLGAVLVIGYGVACAVRARSLGEIAIDRAIIELHRRLP